jgi:acyl-CoA synthetase (AMP-forming)/AMP-acid ligase II
VRDAVVFGVASALRGEEPVACIVGEVSKDALLRHCATALPSWQVPRDFWMLDTLPVNERGKLSRRELSKQYALR